MNIFKKTIMFCCVALFQIATCYDVIRIGSAPHDSSDYMGKKLFENDLEKYREKLLQIGINPTEDKIAHISNFFEPPSNAPDWYTIKSRTVGFDGYINVSLWQGFYEMFGKNPRTDQAKGCVDLMITDHSVVKSLPEGFPSPSFIFLCMPLKVGGKLILTDVNTVIFGADTTKEPVPNIPYGQAVVMPLQISKLFRKIECRKFHNWEEYQRSANHPTQTETDFYYLGNPANVKGVKDVEDRTFIVITRLADN
jgi:hypothetical protein